VSKSVKEILEGQVEELRSAITEVHKLQAINTKRLQDVTKRAGKGIALIPLEEIGADLAEVTASLAESVIAVDQVLEIGVANMLTAITEIHEVAEKSTLRLRGITLAMEEILKSPVAKLVAMVTGKRALCKELLDIENNQAAIVACLSECVVGVQQMKDESDVQCGVTSVPAPAAAQEGE
jgi:hypothetical protein